MRKPAEAGDRVAVPGPALEASFHIAVPGRIGALAQIPQEPETAVLLPEDFGVMKRVIEPDRRHRVQRSIEFPFDRMADDLERARVARIGFDGAAMEVPRELIEHQHQGERPIRGFPPTHEVARAGAPHDVGEAHADLFIDRRTALVPPVAKGQGPVRAVAAVAQPERDDLGDDVGAHGGIVAPRASVR